MSAEFVIKPTRSRPVELYLEQGDEEGDIALMAYDPDDQLTYLIMVIKTDGAYLIQGLPSKFPTDQKGRIRVHLQSELPF